MKMSQGRRTLLYDALARPVQELRIAVSRAHVNGRPMTPMQIDEELYRLEQVLWEHVRSVLLLEGS